MTVEESAGMDRWRRSPLAHRAAEFASLTGGVALVELPFLSMVSLRVAPGSDSASRVESALGLKLPAVGNVSSVMVGEIDGVVAGEVRSVLWLGPDEFLVVGPVGATGDLVTLLIEAIGDDRGSVVDVSANRDTLVLSGPNARDLLEKGCTIDLHPRSFTAGCCAQTTLARGHVLIWQAGAEGAPSGPVYRVLFRGSFADYFADWFIDAAAEFATAGTAQLLGATQSHG
ncbi:MAG TPA: sarcosine oxidase subunit gamma family protein [Kineosporiaceae bacterium]|nr:sarcosine oxidase subunit gamma family protein [Kineosporiaceae bacterium]